MVEALAMSQARALRETGFVVLPSVYDDAFVERARSELTRLHHASGSPELSTPGRRLIWGDRALLSSVGVTFLHMALLAPELASDYLAPPVRALLEAVLGPGVRVETTRGMLSAGGRPMHTWHSHPGGLGEDLPWERRMAGLSGDVIERLTMLIYLDPIDDRGGSLWVYPRRLDEPAESPFPELERAAWPGQVAVACPAGSAVVLEERTWHAALPPADRRLRRFLGGWFTSRSVRPSGVTDETTLLYQDTLFPPPA